MNYKPLTDHNIMELWAFDTCNFRCGYCGLVASGDVTRVDQLEPFRDVGFIDRLIEFFSNHRPKGRPWAVIMTGGEPLMMPNLERFVCGLGRQGDCVAFYTNNSVSPAQLFSNQACSHISYVQCSFHPDWHLGKFEQEKFFDNVHAWVARGVPTLVRFVGAPPLLGMLEELREKSSSAGAGFLPTTLFDPDYPKRYSTQERLKLATAMSGYSSLIQLDGGLSAGERACHAAERLFAVRMHKGGDITPCISVDRPVLGNIFAGTLEPHNRPSNCFKPDSLCTCDIHFQQHVVEGVDDSDNFARILAGESLESNIDYQEWKAKYGIVTTDDIWAGQGIRTSGTDDLIRVAPRSKR